MADIFQASDLSVDLYDRMHPQKLLGSPVAGDVKFYLEQARKTGGPVLELGIGTGRVALPLANAGFPVTGIDTSAPMLRVLRRKITAFPPRASIQAVRASMARFDLRRRFRLIICPFRAFQHLLTPEAQRQCLEAVRRHLAPGGRFIVDIFDPLLSLCAERPGRTRRGRLALPDPDGGRKITVAPVTRSNDVLNQVLTENWIFTIKSKRGRIIRRTRSVVRLRWTYRYEMRYLLELSGLNVLGCFGDFDYGRPRYGAEQIWIASGS